MKKLFFIFLLFIGLLFVNNVNAHDGKLDKNGCHFCFFNCGNYQSFKKHCHIKSIDNINIEIYDDYGPSFETFGGSSYDIKKHLHKSIFLGDDSDLLINGRISYHSNNNIPITYKLAIKRKYIDVKIFDLSVGKNDGRFSIKIKSKDIFDFVSDNKGDYNVYFLVNDNRKEYIINRVNFNIKNSDDIRKDLVSNFNYIMDFTVYNKGLCIDDNVSEYKSFGDLTDYNNNKTISVLNNKCRDVSLNFEYKGITLSGGLLYNFKPRLKFNDHLASTKIKKALLKMDDGTFFNLLSDDNYVTIYNLYNKIDRRANLYIEDDYSNVGKDLIINFRNFIHIENNNSKCCRVCSIGKACGDTCISKYDICHVGIGCACDEE